jgi:4-oxalocrotonate tautomerase
MPVVSIKFVKGRTLEQKRDLVSAVTKAVAETIDVDPGTVWVHLDEFDPYNFATGGLLLSDK